MKSSKALLKNVTILIFISLLFACRRDKIVTVSGRLVGNCDQIGVGNHKLKMSYTKSKSYFTSSKIQSNSNAGSGVTDDKGNFSFNILHQSSNGEWFLIDENNGQTYRVIMYAMSNSKLELGEVFADSLQYRAKVNLTFKNRIDDNDTFFCKVNDKTDTLFLKDQKKLQLDFEKTPPYVGQIPYIEEEWPFQWGFGHNDFMKKDSIHLVKIKFSTCSFQPYINNLELFK